MNLLEARRQSHETRNAVTYDIRFSDDGVVVEPDNTFANMMGGMTAPEQTGENLFGFTGADVANTAKAAGRAVAGGVQDAVTGVVGLADDIGTAIDNKIGGLGYITLGPNGLEYTREKTEGAPRLDELFDAGLQELGVKVPQGDSPVEAMARGLVQFGAGMVAAPIRGAGYANTMLRGGFADALFDPEEGNLSTLLKEFGLDGAVLNFLDSKVDDEASAEQRLTARLKQTLEGAGISLPIDFIVQGFKALRSEEGASEIIRNKLTTVKDRLTQPGEMPTVGSLGGNIGVDTSYRMQHQPNEEGAPLFDMTGGGEFFPDDIYSSNGLRFYGNPNSEFDRESYEIIQKVRGNPEAEVTIYRAVPNEESISTINPGDFVTISKKYAELHGESGYGKDGTDKGKILSIKVKAKDLKSEGNDLNEFGYFPKSVQKPDGIKEPK